MDYSRCLVVIPTYNEVDNIGVLVHEIVKLYPGIKILVVDDRSPDGTFKLVEEEHRKNSNVSLLLGENREGFSVAYQKAFKAVLNMKGIDWIIIMDADFSHSPEYIKKFIEESPRADMVIGSRFVNGGSAPGMNFKRRLLSYLGNLYIRIVTGLDVKDLTTGFMAFDIKVLPIIIKNDLLTRGFACLIEMKYKVLKAGFKCVEVPIVFGSRLNGYSKISWKIILEGLIAPWRLKFS